MSQERKLLLVHHFALSRVTGVVLILSDLLERIPAVRPATRVDYESYEGHGSPDDFSSVLASRHSDADCVVAVNVHIEVGWEYTVRLVEWCNRANKTLYLYVHDYWPHHRACTDLLVGRHGARVLASTAYIRAAVERDGFRSDLAPVGVPLSYVETHSGIRESDHSRPAVVASVGRLVPRKRFVDVVRAFCRARVDDQWSLFLRLLPSLTYRAPEDEQLVQQIRTEARKASAEEAIRIERAALEKNDYERYAVYVCASDYEGLSMTPIESTYSACPPLMSDIPAHRAIADVLFPGCAADFLYPPGDVEALTRLMAHEIATGERSLRLRSTLEELRGLIETRWSLCATAEALAGLLDA